MCFTIKGINRLNNLYNYCSEKQLNIVSIGHIHELKFDNVKPFVTIFGKFCKRFPDNNYILTSRPNTDFREFQRFAVFQISELTIENIASVFTIPRVYITDKKVLYNIGL